MKRIILLLALVLLSACQTLNVSVPQGHCEHETSKKDCSNTYASKFNRVIINDDEFPEVEFTGYLLSIDKSKPAKYGMSAIADYRLSYTGPSEAWEIDFSLSDSLPSEALSGRIRKTFEGQRKNMFVTSITGYKTGVREQFVITRDCKNQNFRLYQTYIDCSFLALEGFENSLSQEIRRGLNNGKPYSHIILHSTGWNNGPPDSVKHYDEIYKSLTGFEIEGFRPLFIGITWPAEWDIPFISLANKANDADEIGLTWVSYLMHKTIPNAIETLPANNKPKFVAMGHSLGARMMATAASSKQFLQSENKSPEASLDYLILLQSAFSGRRLYTDPEEDGWLSHLYFYDTITDNANAVMITASDEDSGVSIAKWVDGGVGHFSSGKAHRRTCAKVRESEKPKFWQDRFICHHQDDGQRYLWGRTFQDLDDKRILLLRLNSDRKGASDKEHIISKHNDVKDDDVAEVILELIGVISP